MLNRGRFIQGRGPRSQSKGKKSNDQVKSKDRSFSSRGTKGQVSSGHAAPPASLRESLEMLNQRSNSSGNSSKMAEKWLVGEHGEEGYNLEVPTRHNDGDSDFDCSDSVSSLNDSVYFGGGASVTGGYSSRHRSALDMPTHHGQSLGQSNANLAPRGSPLQHAKSLVVGVVPGSSDAPINLLSTMTRPRIDDDLESDLDGDIVTLQTSDPSKLVANDKESHQLCRAEQGRANDDQESEAVFTAAQSAVDDLDEFFPALHGSPSAFQKIHSQDCTTALSPASAASQSEESDPKTNSSRLASGGCRDFIQSAPGWLKFVFALSILALIGAVVLLTVGLNVAWDVHSNTSESAAAQQRNPQSSARTSAPTVEFLPQVITRTPPTLSPVKILKTSPPTGKPVAATKASKQEVVQTESPTESPTALPTEADELVSNDSKEEDPSERTAFPIAPTPVPATSQPTVFPPIISALSSASPTKAPTAIVPAGETGDAGPSKWTIYLTTGRYSDDLQQEMTSSMGSILSDNGTDASSFLVHLGDWGDAVTCDETSFQGVSELFRASSVPVYFVVGDNEYNDCPDPNAAKALWNTYLLNFETKHWPDPPWTIFRQGDSSVEYAAYSENFIFAHGPAAFMSINLGDGETDNPTESQPRLEANLAWIDTAYNFYHDDPSVTTIFIFADDGPPGSTMNDGFFRDLLERISTSYTDIDFVFVHRGLTDWSHTQEYEGIKNLDVVQALGPIWPPIRMSVEFEGEKRSIKLDDAW